MPACAHVKLVRPVCALTGNLLAPAHVQLHARSLASGHHNPTFAHPNRMRRPPCLPKQDTLHSLRPRLVRFSSYQEALDAVGAIIAAEVAAGRGGALGAIDGGLLVR